MSDDHPDARRYGPIIIFLLVFAMLMWALALRRLGAR